MSGPRLSGRALSALRAAWATRLPLDCPRCGLPIHPAEPFDLGHRVDLALGGHPHDLHPEHSRCNRQAGGRLGNQLRALRPGPGILRRDWTRP
jgi:hypothetical protein